MWTRLFLSVLLLLPITARAATETVEMVQVSPKVTLETTVFKPDGPGPFPLVVMNHGKNPVAPSKQDRTRFIYLAREFLKRGYAVVVPMRQGFSKSTGIYGDGDCDLTTTGRLAANDVQLTLDYFTKLPWVDKNRIIVAGQSMGGLAALAFTERTYPGVLGTINFMGGLKFSVGCFNWRTSLSNAAEAYGHPENVPMLWFYAPEDSFFGPDVYWPMYAAYSRTRARVKIVTEYPRPYTNDPHVMVQWSDGAPLWWPETEKFLAELGLPTEDLKTGETLPTP